MTKNPYASSDLPEKSTRNPKNVSELVLDRWGRRLLITAKVLLALIAIGYIGSIISTAAALPDFGFSGWALIAKLFQIVVNAPDLLRSAIVGPLCIAAIWFLHRGARFARYFAAALLTEFVAGRFILLFLPRENRPDFNEYGMWLTIIISLATISGLIFYKRSLV